MELRCLTWAQALLNLVYDVMDNTSIEGGLPVHLKHPTFRFVHAALAIEQGKDKWDTKAFMIEEMIKGSFRKYLNNTSPIPSKFSAHGNENMNCADFLAFSQHVQYWKTEKLVFVADYQGILYSYDHHVSSLTSTMT